MANAGNVEGALGQSPSGKVDSKQVLPPKETMTASREDALSVAAALDAGPVALVASTAAPKIKPDGMTVSEKHPSKSSLLVGFPTPINTPAPLLDNLIKKDDTGTLGHLNLQDMKDAAKITSFEWGLIKARVSSSATQENTRRTCYKHILKDIRSKRSGVGKFFMSPIDRLRATLRTNKAMSKSMTQKMAGFKERYDAWYQDVKDQEIAELAAEKSAAKASSSTGTSESFESLHTELKSQVASLKDQCKEIKESLSEESLGLEVQAAELFKQDQYHVVAETVLFNKDVAKMDRKIDVIVEEVSDGLGEIVKLAGSAFETAPDQAAMQELSDAPTGGEAAVSQATKEYIAVKDQGVEAAANVGTAVLAAVDPESLPEPAQSVANAVVNADLEPQEGASLKDKLATREAAAEKIEQAQASIQSDETIQSDRKETLDHALEAVKEEQLSKHSDLALEAHHSGLVKDRETGEWVEVELKGAFKKSEEAPKTVREVIAQSKGTTVIEEPKKPGVSRTQKLVRAVKGRSRTNEDVKTLFNVGKPKIMGRNIFLTMTPSREEIDGKHTLNFRVSQPASSNLELTYIDGSKLQRVVLPHPNTMNGIRSNKSLPRLHDRLDSILSTPLLKVALRDFIKASPLEDPDKDSLSFKNYVSLYRSLEGSISNSEELWALTGFVTDNSTESSGRPGAIVKKFLGRDTTFDQFNTSFEIRDRQPDGSVLFQASRHTAKSSLYRFMVPTKAGGFELRYKKIGTSKEKSCQFPAVDTLNALISKNELKTFLSGLKPKSLMELMIVDLEGPSETADVESVKQMKSNYKQFLAVLDELAKKPIKSESVKGPLAKDVIATPDGVDMPKPEPIITEAALKQRADYVDVLKALSSRLGEYKVSQEIFKKHNITLELGPAQAEIDGFQTRCDAMMMEFDQLSDAYVESNGADLKRSVSEGLALIQSPEKKQCLDNMSLIAFTIKSIETLGLKNLSADDASGELATAITAFNTMVLDGPNLTPQVESVFKEFKRSFSPTAAADADAVSTGSDVSADAPSAPITLDEGGARPDTLADGAIAPVAADGAAASVPVLPGLDEKELEETYKQIKQGFLGLTGSETGTTKALLTKIETMDVSDRELIKKQVQTICDRPGFSALSGNKYHTHFLELMGAVSSTSHDASYFKSAYSEFKETYGKGKDTAGILKIIKSMRSGKPVKKELDLVAMKSELDQLSQKPGFKSLDAKDRYKNNVLKLLEALA